ncbi:unnamed protein product [Closterium sp. NIES-53]
MDRCFSPEDAAMLSAPWEEVEVKRALLESRDYLFEVLRRMGFPEVYVKWVEGLHHGAATRICNDGWLGDEVPVQTGVRQGCPLAPYLFLCAVEPLCQEAQRRRLGVDITGAGKLTYLGYADDITFFLEGGRSWTWRRCCSQRDETSPVATPFKWAAPDEPERLLGVWITSGGDARPSWRRAVSRMEAELKKWEEKYLTTTAKVAVINAYGMPIALFQAQAYPPPDTIWEELCRHCHAFVSGGRASAGPGFILWSAELMQMRRGEGGLGVINLRNRPDAEALQSAGELLTVESSQRRAMAEKAACFPLGYASFCAHEALPKAWGGGSERWKEIAAVVMASLIAWDLPSRHRWDVEKERVFYNRHILRGGSCPFGRRKGDECLRNITVGDLLMKWVAGTRSPKSLVQLERLLGSKQAAELAAEVFEAIPVEWKARILKSLSAEEIGEATRVVRTINRGEQ